MPETATQVNAIKGQFVYLATELSNRFPDLDLRFNLQNDTATLRFVAAAVSTDVIELDLGEHETTDLLNAAILQIKEMARIFDA